MSVETQIPQLEPEVTGGGFESAAPAVEFPDFDFEDPDPSRREQFASFLHNRWQQGVEFAASAASRAKEEWDAHSFSLQLNGELSDATRSADVRSAPLDALEIAVDAIHKRGIRGALGALAFSGVLQATVERNDGTRAPKNVDLPLNIGHGR